MSSNELSRPSIDDQISCAVRECEMRQRVYASWVKSGKMSEDKADHEIRCMYSIVDTLKWAKKMAEKMRGKV